MDHLELRPADKEWLQESEYGAHFQQRDRDDMMRMGKQQQFQRNFRVIAISSFSVVTMMGWVFLPINAPVVIEVAGTGGCITIFLANFFGFLSTVLSLAEMSSIAPTSGGQYHWTSEFAPSSMQKFLSYISGWLSSLSWLVGVASGVYLVGNLIPSLIALQNPEFEPHAWQGYLFVVAIMLATFLINGFLAKHLPLLEGFVFCFTIIAFVAIVIVLLVLSPKATGSEVFQTFTPDLGSRGLLELFAVQVIIFFSFLGSDATVHMSEEVQQAAVVVPRAMVWSYCINGLLDFIILVAICFCWVDPEAYANTTTGYAFLELFITATGSTTGAIAITSVMVILVVLSATNFVASTSRQVFAFARDDGLPFSGWISKVNQRTLTPINSLVVVTMFTVLITLIGLGSTVAFNAIVSLQVMAIAGTYQVSLVCLVWRRLFGRRLPPAQWSLGKWGLALNLLSIVYGWYLLVYSAMPSEYPVTANNFNWAPVMFGGVMALSLLYYFIWARRIYEGPVVHVAHG